MTSHGFALNSETDLEFFREHIMPCGLEGMDVTSLKELVGGEVKESVGGGDCGRVCERVWIYGGVYETLLVVVLKKVEREVDVRLFICNLLFCVVVILI